MTINTTNQSSFLNNIINDVHNRLREDLVDVNEQSVAFHVNRLWNTLLTGEDFTATTSSEANDGEIANVDETASDTLSLKIDIVALSCLIMADHSTVIDGLDVGLRIVLQQSVKTVENTSVLECLYTQLMLKCLTDGPFSSSSIKQCEYIRRIIQICEEFEKDLALGLLDLLKHAVEATDDFNRNQNRHTHGELNSMNDCSIEFPDLCWFNICQYLSIRDIAQLSSTCRTLRHMLWSSHRSSMWIYLIHLKFHSSILCRSIRALFDEDEDEDTIIAENNRFSQRLLSDIEAYEVLYEKFLDPKQYRSWHVSFTLAEKEKRGFFAWRRFLFPSSIPLLDCSIVLSSKLVRLYYYRLNKKSILAPIGALIYGYLIDPHRCLSVGDMFYRNNTMPKDERRLMKIDNDGGGVSVTRYDDSSVSPLVTYLFFDQIPLWPDLLPGRYNLTCQMRLRRHFVDDYPNGNYLGGEAPFEICLLGDRADRGGRWNILRYPWLQTQHQKYGDDRWFNVSLVQNFLLNDISNVYFGIRVKNKYPILFDVWINTIQLNLIAIN